MVQERFGGAVSYRVELMSLGGSRTWMVPRASMTGRRLGTCKGSGKDAEGLAKRLRGAGVYA